MREIIMIYFIRILGELEKVNGVIEIVVKNFEGKFLFSLLSIGLCLRL